MKNSLTVTLLIVLFFLLSPSAKATVADSQQVKERIPVKFYTKYTSTISPYFCVFPPGVADTVKEEKSNWKKEVTTGKEERISEGVMSSVETDRFDVIKSAAGVWLPLISIFLSALLIHTSLTKFWLTFALPISFCAFYFFLGPEPIILGLYLLAYLFFAIKNKKSRYWVFVGLPFIFPVYALAFHLKNTDPTGIAYFAGYCFVLALAGTFIHNRFMAKRKNTLELIK